MEFEFTKESMQKVKKMVESYDFRFYGDLLQSKDLVICTCPERDRITVRREIIHGEDVRAPEINWSAIGAVNIEEAQKFSNDFQKALAIARLLESDLKIEKEVDKNE